VLFQPLCSHWVNGVNGGNDYDHFVAAKHAFKTLELVSHLHSFLLKEDTSDSLKRDANKLTCMKTKLCLSHHPHSPFSKADQWGNSAHPGDNKGFSLRQFSSFTFKLISPKPLFSLRPLEYPKFKIEPVTLPGLRESRSLLLLFRSGLWEHSVRCPDKKAVIFYLQHNAQIIFMRVRLPFLKPRIQSSKRRNAVETHP